MTGDKDVLTFRVEALHIDNEPAVTIGVEGRALITMPLTEAGELASLIFQVIDAFNEKYPVERN